MAIAPGTPFLFNPFPAQMPILPARQPVQSQSSAMLPARLGGASRNGEDEDQAAANGDGGLPPWAGDALTAALLAFGAGSSIKQGSAAPFVGTATGFLSGLSQRQQREAQAAALAEQDRLDREAEERQQAFENAPKISIGPQGSTISGVPVDAAAAPSRGLELPSELQPDILGMPGGTGLPGSGLGAAGAGPATAALDSPMARAMEQFAQIQKRFPATPKPPRTFTDPVAGGLWIEDPETQEWRRVEGPALKAPEPPERITVAGGVLERDPETGEYYTPQGAPAPKPPSPSGLSAADQKEVNLVDGALLGTKRYRELIEEWLTLPTTDQLKAMAGDRKHQRLLSSIQSARNMITGMLRVPITGPGVMNDTDRKMILDAIGNPLSMETMARGPEYLRSKIDEVDAMLRSKKSLYQPTTTQPTASPPSGDTDDLGAYGDLTPPPR